MELPHFVHELFKVLWPLLPVIGLVKLLKSRWFKGFWGELWVRATLRRHLDPGRYHILSNVTLPTSDGSTQIDHILVSSYGVFVLETKNMQGLILGEEREAQWQQRFGGLCRDFQNPLHQNYKHTKTIQEITGIKGAALFSLIVFVGNSSFGRPLPENVVQRQGLIPWIHAKKRPLLIAAQIQEILQTLQRTRLRNSFSTRRKHIRHVQALVAQKKLALAAQEPSCPLCGGEMHLREAKRGRNAGQSFWGCLAFPTCRGTRKRP
jgi:hypothetical protein